MTNKIDSVEILVRDDVICQQYRVPPPTYTAEAAVFIEAMIIVNITARHTGIA